MSRNNEVELRRYRDKAFKGVTDDYYASYLRVKKKARDTHKYIKDSSKTEFLQRIMNDPSKNTTYSEMLLQGLTPMEYGNQNYSNVDGMYIKGNRK